MLHQGLALDRVQGTFKQCFRWDSHREFYLSFCFFVYLYVGFQVMQHVTQPILSSSLNAFFFIAPIVVFAIAMIQLLPLLLIEHFSPHATPLNLKQVFLVSLASISPMYLLQAGHFFSYFFPPRIIIHFFLNFPMTIYGGLGALLLNVFLFDLLGYLIHRAMHRYNWLWRFHATHHAITDVKALSAVQHVVDMTLMQAVPALILSPLIIIGGEAPLFLSWYVLIHNWLIHAELPFLNYGFFNYVIGGPAFHRAHHCSEETFHNKNFAFFFPWIDMLLGTYKKPSPHYFYGPFGVQGRNNPRRLKDIFL